MAARSLGGPRHVAHARAARPTRRDPLRAFGANSRVGCARASAGSSAMNGAYDWAWKLREAAERLRTRYDHIGRKTGAPFLAIIYPPEVERSLLKEWHTLAATLEPEFSIRTVDVLDGARASFVRVRSAG